MRILIGKRNKDMGNIGYIFGYAVILAFCLGVIVGMVAQKIGDR